MLFSEHQRTSGCATLFQRKLQTLITKHTPAQTALRAKQLLLALSDSLSNPKLYRDNAIHCCNKQLECCCMAIEEPLRSRPKRHNLKMNDNCTNPSPPQPHFSDSRLANLQCWRGRIGLSVPARLPLSYRIKSLVWCHTTENGAFGAHQSCKVNGWTRL